MEILNSITLFGSIFWGVAALVILIGLCFWADVEEEGWIALIIGIIFGVIFYLFGRDTLHNFFSLLTFVNISLYLGVGLLYAFVRIFFYGRNQAYKFNEEKKTNKSEYYTPRIDRDIKSHVFRWWFLWPISLINWVIKDVVRDVYNFAYDKLSRVFNFVLDLGIKSVPDVPTKKDK